jgi:hypothetical protein
VRSSPVGAVEDDVDPVERDAPRIEVDLEVRDATLARAG